MKKTIIIFLLTIYLISPISFAQEEIINSEIESLKISDLIQEGEKYTQETFKDINLDETLQNALKGNIDNKSIYSKLLAIAGEEVIDAIRILASFLIIVVISSILKNVADNLENKSVAQITYYIIYILIVTLIMTNFSKIISNIKETISNLIGITNSLIPILLALMTATGNGISATAIEPIILTVIIFVANTITSFILPIVLVATAMSIVSNLSENVQIDKLSKSIKSGILWFLGILTTGFTMVLSFEGTLTSNVDGITAKTLKTSVSTFVPVVGKALSESADTVLGCTSILKNAIGIVGMIIIVGICAAPIIKLTILTAMYKVSSAICEPISDKRIVNLLEQMSSTFKVLLGIMFFISALIIIGLAITLKISNSTIMYR